MKRVVVVLLLATACSSASTHVASPTPLSTSTASPTATAPATAAPTSAPTVTATVTARPSAPAAPTATATTAPGLPKLLDCVGGVPAVRKATFRLGCQGSSPTARVDWSSWDTKAGSGRGSVLVPGHGVFQAFFYTSEVTADSGARFMTLLRVAFLGRFPGRTREASCTLAVPSGKALPKRACLS